MIFTEYAKRPTGFAAGLLFCVSGVKIFPESGRSEHCYDKYMFNRFKMPQKNYIARSVSARRRKIYEKETYCVPCGRNGVVHGGCSVCRL